MDEIVYSKILKLLRTRDRSEKEILEYLEKSGVASSDSAFFIDRLRSSKLISDVRFAESKIRSRIYNQHWGKERIKLELVEFGISSEIIEDEISKIEESVWLENCERLIERNRINKKKQSEVYKLKKKLFQMGYPQVTIKKAFTNQNISEEFEIDLE
ncbi:MAG: regulatory protein RecX [Leptospiraceae bacterium]|nr:regulatory protein RecX [Leptospiraceae bacterium]